MLKKLMIISSALSVSACSTLYEISDEDTKKLVMQTAPIDICIKRIIPLNKYHQQATQELFSNILANTIGANNMSLLDSQHFNKTYKKIVNKLNKEKQPVPQLSTSQCNELKKQLTQRAEQLEKEEQARQAFYTTPEGQAYLAQQRIIQQQQNMQTMQYLQQLNQQHNNRSTTCYNYGNTINCNSYSY